MGCSCSTAQSQAEPKPIAARGAEASKPQQGQRQVVDDGEGIGKDASRGVAGRDEQAVEAGSSPKEACTVEPTSTTLAETDGESPATCGGSAGEDECSLASDPNITGGHAGGGRPPGSSGVPGAGPASPDDVVPACGSEPDVTGHGEAEELYAEAVAALADWRNLAAAEKLKAAQALDPSGSARPPGLEAVCERAEFIKRMFATCRPPKGQPGWTYLPLSDGQHEAQGWTRWVDGGTTVQIIFQFSSDGSLVQQLASIRDGDVLEQLWGGLSWDMSNQHADGRTVSNWKERTPVIGKQVEVLFERFFCNCLDDPDLPGWIIAERSPQIPDLNTFAGAWGPFNIPSPVKGFTRTPDVECGRVVEPLGSNRVRVTSVITIPIPGFVRWFVSDTVVSLALKAGVKLGHRSWQKVVDAWSTSGMDERLQRESAFYGAAQKSLDKFVAATG